MKPRDIETIKELFRAAQSAYVTMKCCTTTNRERDNGADNLQAAIFNASAAIADIDKIQQLNTELRTALELLLSVPDADGPEAVEALKLARAAISKAKGE